MIKIAIIEDEKQVCERLVAFLKKYADLHNYTVSTTHFYSAEPFLASDVGDYDVVFMDIELPGINGFSAVQELRKIDNEIAVIFVTNLAQYAVHGYEVSAFDFIVKPLKYNPFALKMDRLFVYLSTTEKKKLCISSREGKRIVPISDLKYVEIIKHRLIFHTLEGEIECSGTLKKVCGDLEGLSFARCNACYLVNLRYVTEIKGNTVVLENEELQMSAPKRKEFMSKLTAYLAAGGGRLV